MGKARKEAAKKQASTSGAASGLLVASAIAVLALAAAALYQSTRSDGTSSDGTRNDSTRTEPAAPAQAPVRAEAEERGPPAKEVGKLPLVKQLTELLQEVQKHTAAAAPDERAAAMARAEEELTKLDSSIDPSDPLGEQQHALVNLVREAFDAERSATDLPDARWNDEALHDPYSMSTYSTQQYWDLAYAEGRYGETYDWYGSWAEASLDGRTLRDVVRPLLPLGPKILVLGCGNSDMSALMYADGYGQITNVDISEVVIARMRQRYADLRGMTWMAMDATKLSFKRKSFDVVVEKGLLDVLVAGTGEKASLVMKEISRVLRPGGRAFIGSVGKKRLQDFLAEQGNASGHGRLDCEVVSDLQYSRESEAQSESDNLALYKCDSR